ncbi:tetratricopeptide repeat protein [Mucisphaera calidilacus]|uniref:Tetratricopeptide repeat protein n=1 Tax=Mucisphaera calidilacus TaxID=2527982 RepID=A0A518BTG9_9BACT|nr:tetratricopeptide repeat protein [Mucisphaera calidilacus]QDU70255.1 tetratricopeptide repeat protein [Mucisphaera calidilacus]
MAKQRINTPFLIILVAALVVVVGGAAIFYFQFVQRDAETRIAEAQAYYEQGEYRLAIEEIGKAISHDPNNIELLNIQYDYMREAPVADVQQAQKRLNSLRSIRRKVATLQLSDPEAQRAYYSFLNEMRRELDSAFADVMYDAANDRLGNVQDDRVALKYRGVATAARIARGTAMEDQREQARADLKAVLEQTPDDAEALEALAILDINRADRIARLAADDPEIAELRAEAIDALERLSTAAGQDIEQQLRYVQLALNPVLGLRDQAQETFGQIEGSLAASGGSRRQVLAAMAILNAGARGGPTVSDPELAGGRAEAIMADRDRAVRLGEAVLEIQPDNASVNLQLATLYRGTNQPQKAVAAAEKARSLADAKAPPIETLLSRQVKLVASLEMATSLFLIANQRDAEGRQPVLDQIGEIVKELNITFPDRPQVTMLAGKLAFARQDFRQAAIYFDQASSRYGESNLEALYLLAKTHAILKQWGEAATRLESVLSARPSYTEARQELIQVYLAEQNPADARRHIEYLLASDPENTLARTALIQIVLQYGSRAEKEAALEPLLENARANNQPPGMIAVRLLKALDRNDEARDALLEANALTPNNPQILGQLIPLLEDEARQTQLIDAYESSGGDAKVVQVLRALIDESSLSEVVSGLVQTTPFARARAEAQNAMRQRDIENAREAIAEAEALEPDNPAVVELKFDFAMIQQDWDGAMQVAEVARQRNLDKVQGKFFRARVFAAQQRYEEATVELNEGLEIDRVNPEIRTLLAEIYRQQGLYDQAAAELDQALSQRGNNLKALRLLAAIRNEQGRADEALEHLRRAYQLQPKDPGIRNLYLLYETQHGRADLAMEARERIAEEEPADYANKRALASMLSTTDDRKDEAITLAEQIIADDGMKLANVATLANVLFRNEQAEAGEREIQRYIATLGNEVAAQDYQLLARYRLQRQDLPAAVQAYRQGITLEDPASMPMSRELAALLFSRGESDLSTALYEKLHRAFPDEAPVTLRLVESYLRAERNEDARAFLENQDNQTDTIILLKSELALKEGDRELALDYVNQALDINPDSIPGLVRRANLTGFDQPDAALVDLDRALTLDPTQIQARLLLSDIRKRSGDYNGSIRELQNVLNRDARQVQAREKLYAMYMLTGDYALARATVNDGIETFPNDTRWLRYAARVAVRENRLPEAVQALNQAVQIDPSAANIRALLALQVDNNRADLALRLIDQNPNVTANDPTIQGIRGAALAQTGQREAAQRVFAKAMERARSYGEMNAIADRVQKSFDVPTAITLLVDNTQAREPLWSQLAAARLETNDGRYDDAVSRLRALEGQVETADQGLRFQLLTLLGRALQLSEAFEDARVAYEKVLEIAPSDILTLNNLAYLLGNDLGETSAAVEFAQRAVNLAPQNANTLDTLGWVQYQNGQLEEARRTLERSISFSRLPVNQYHLAIVLTDLGSTAAAMDLLEDAIRDAQTEGDDETLEKAQQRLKTLQQG